MAAVDRSRSPLNSDNRATSKGPESSTVSISSDNDDLHKSTDGALGDKLKSRNSDDGRSDTSSVHRIRMSRMFKGRNKRRKSTSHTSLESQMDAADDPPPVPPIRNYSDDSLGLHKSAASSLLTEDSDADTT
jgi:hypothetical protein